MENMEITQIIQHHRKPIVCIQTFKTGDDGPLSLERTLNEYDPSYVIMYHCNVTAIRQIEVFEARKRRVQSQRLKVFFMVHAQTVEEQSYLTSLRREKQAFELIIDTKSVSISSSAFYFRIQRNLRNLFNRMIVLIRSENGGSGASRW